MMPWLARSMAFLAATCLLVAAACDDPKPALSGRLRAPAGIAHFKGCAQNNPACNKTEDGRHLLLVSNALADDVRLFDAEKRSFFKALNPLFPQTIPVGLYPRGIGVDPFGEWAMVVNQLSEDVSLIDLAPNRMVEVDTDGDASTVAASLNCPDDPHQVTAPTNDRCRAGVSRAALSEDGAQLLPDQIAIPSGDRTAEDGAVWPRELGLPVWVSLPAAGRVVLLEFRYPSVNNPHLLTYVASIDLGGRPSGLAINQDGSKLYVADEESDSIAVVDTVVWEVSRVVVDGPTRRVALTPDESVLYAVRLDEPRIALVDTNNLERRPAYTAEDPLAQDPRADGLDIQVPGIPREVVFVTGQLISTEGLEGATVPYPWTYIPATCDDPDIETLGPPTTTFGYVSDLNGNVYIVDAERHGTIDLRPTVGPSVGPTGYSEPDGEVLSDEDLHVCSNPSVADYTPSCATPYIAEIHRTREVDNEVEEIFRGMRVFPGRTRTEGWILVWEGVIPETQGSDAGRFEGWNLADDRIGLDFSELQIQDDDLLQIETGYAADPDGSGGFHPACLQADGTPRSVFRIEGVNVDGHSLSIKPVSGVDPGLCWPGAVRYHIRVHDAWTVFGTESGGYPRLTRAEHMIAWDAPVPPEPLYSNGSIALTMVEPGPDIDGNSRKIPRDSAWGFSTESGYASAFFAPSVRVGMAGPLLPIDMDDGGEQDREDTFCDLVVGPATDRVYLVFEASNALMEFFPGSLESGNFLLYQ